MLAGENIFLDHRQVVDEICSCQLEDVGGKMYSGTLEEFMLLEAEERARLVQGTLASR